MFRLLLHIVSMKFFLRLIILILFNSSYIPVFAEGAPKNYLKGKFYSTVKNNFLVATDKMRDNRFSKTVIVMLENDEDGAWGLVINKNIGEMPLGLLIDPSINTDAERKELLAINVPVYWGGPVDVEEIFILHSSEYESKSTKRFGDISISKDYNILFDISKNRGPKRSLIIFGYSGWASGQLEGEMEKNHWDLSEIDLDLIFTIENDMKWIKAIKNSYIRL